MKSLPALDVAFLVPSLSTKLSKKVSLQVLNVILVVVLTWTFGKETASLNHAFQVRLLKA